MRFRDIVNESPESCPHCGGPMFSEMVMMEKKDACYYKVKASAKVWPSAYASGRLVQCRKKGAANYGNKSESVEEGSEEITWIKPNFDYEWDEIEFQADAPQVPADVRNYMARHFPDKQAWMKSVQHGRPVVLRPDHGQKIRNYPDNKRDLLNALSPQSHDPQGPAKAKRVNALFDKGGPIEMPIILQTEKGLWLIGGKTRLGTANLLKGIPAKVWIIGGEQGVAEDQLNEKWSQKYKSSINCSHPKGFSQKAHCAGKKKHNESVEMEMVCEDCGMCETHQDHENLDEACWKGYHKEGMKELFGKRVPNCVKNEDKEMNMDELSRILELGTGLSMQARAELHEEFDLIESIIETIAEHNGVDSEMVWEDLETLSEDELYVFAVTSQPIMESEAWQKANNRDKTDGMSRKAVNTYRREHPGSKLQTAVTTKPSKLKKGSKASKRRKSYCSRSRGQMKMHSISCAKTPDKAICKARRRWNC